MVNIVDGTMEVWCKGVVYGYLGNHRRESDLKTGALWWLIEQCSGE